MAHDTHEAHDAHEAQELIRQIVDLEWEQFQQTQNQGGRAQCQNNRPMFCLMRVSQFETWPVPLLRSYLEDLQHANATHRNLITEKYARMMASTDPEEYHKNIAPHIQQLSKERQAQQERIITRQVDWAADFMHCYPKLGQSMRVLRTSQDGPNGTSFETYLRGELGTYSQRTLDLYEQFVQHLAENKQNLSELTVGNTVRLAGLGSLEDAERQQ